MILSEVPRNSSAIEVFSLILPSFLLTYIVVNFTSRYFDENSTDIRRVLLEFLVIPTWITLFITSLSGYIVFANLVLIPVAVFVILINQNVMIKKNLKTHQDNGTYNSVANVRSIINLISVIAILAVDFNVFPKRFAKTERYGYSLMDVGVGLYVFSNGIVAPEIKAQKTISLEKSLMNVTVLLIMGVIRYFLTTGVKYQVMVTEYGIHWNFFITLAVTKLLSSLIMIVFKCNQRQVSKYVCIGLALLAIHDAVLQLGLANYAMGAIPRTNFVSANREGIVSSTGYVALYFLSVAVGHLYHSSREKTVLKMSMQLLSATFILAVGSYISNEKYRVSRCLANSAYCLWILFIGVFMTTLFYISENLQYLFYTEWKKMHKVPIIHQAINFNGLLFFLVANLLTGIINLLIDTQNVTTIYSFIIIFVYIFIVIYINLLMYKKNMKMLSFLSNKHREIN